MSKEELIQQIFDEGLFHMDAPIQVTNGFGTFMLLFPKDWENKAVRERKLHEVMRRSYTKYDEAVINMFQHLQPFEYMEPLATMGLYLALADSISRLNLPIEQRLTLLSILRDGEAGLPQSQDFDRETMYQKALQAFPTEPYRNEAGEDIFAEAKEILKQWYETGKFTYAGDEQSVVRDAQTGALEIKGGYMRLAEVLCEGRSEPDFNIAISYALGNRQQQICTSGRVEEAYLSNVTTAIDDPEERQIRINLGYEMRMQRLREACAAAMENNPAAHQFGTDAIRERGHAILQYFPNDALALLLRKKITLCYTDEEDIHRFYNVSPATQPNLGHARIASLQSSVGLREEKHGILFLSNGMRPDPEGISGEARQDLHARRAVQSALHELFHEAFGDMPSGKQQSLLRAAAKVTLPKDAENVWPFATMSASSVADIMDYRRYTGYKEEEAKQEVLCNLFSLYVLEPEKLPLGYQYEVLYGAINKAFEKQVGGLTK